MSIFSVPSRRGVPMKTKLILSVASMVLSVTGNTARADDAVKTPPRVTPSSHPAPAANTGYLVDRSLDLMQVLSPAPTAGDPRFEADREIFRASRKWAGTPRWALAIRDINLEVSYLLSSFSCAVGVKLTPENVPHVTRLGVKSVVDTLAQNRAAKAFYRRQRPYTVDEGVTCQDTKELHSFDYPSGHSTAGWTWATILSQLVPSQATEILARGRVYGESRVVCGAHNFSSVQAGRLSATVTMNVIETVPAFQRDFVAAKAELEKILQDPKREKPTNCEAEAKLIQASIF